jgi:LPS export ABC transporter permease LptG/LPS export ABC transporter permease LptF
MRILSRYIAKEMLAPTLIGFGFYTFVILIRQLFDFAEMIIKRSLPIGTVLELLALSLPHIIVLTIPMSLLFGILIAVGRLSADSEIIAMRSLGLSTSTIYRPVFAFSFVIFLLNLYLMNTVLPAGNTLLQARMSEIFTSSVEREIKPRVFYDEYANRVIYVNDVDTATGAWKGVFISDTTDPTRQNIVIAERGHLSLVGKSKQVWIDLEGAETHVVSDQSADRYDQSRNSSQRILLLDKFSDEVRQQSKSFKEMTFRELDKARRKFTDPIDRRTIAVEMNKKFAIPFACLAFGIIGLPLGITNRRGGKSSGFSLSIGLILVYYVLLSNGEDAARAGKIGPALAMWAPNILLSLFGIYLLWRANRDAGSGGNVTVARLLERLGAWRDRRSASRRTAGGSSDTSLLARLDLAFPNTLDRYVTSEFVKIFALVLVSTASLFLIVDYTDLAGEITENDVAFSVVAAYYRYYILQVMHYTIPLSVLLATLVTFGMFSRNSEVTAMKANGVSLYRIALPVILIAIVVSGFAYLLLDFVLPYANERTIELKAQIKGRETRRAFSVDQRQWVFGEGRYLFNYLSFNRQERYLSKVQVFEFDDDAFKIRRRIAADEARFDGVGWVFTKGWIRTFRDDGSSTFTPFSQPIRLPYPERPEYFASEEKLPSQMTYVELYQHIRNLKRSGYAADELEVKLFEKTSWPFVSLVMAVIALPFSFRIGKQGSLQGIAIAIVLAFLYWMVFATFTKFGEVGNLPAILSAWSANILFLIAAVYMFIHVET